MPYTKARPDQNRLVSIDESIVDRLGGVQKKGATILLASWLTGGVAFSEKRVETPSGVVVVPRGHVWGSLYSAQEDLLYATGERFTYGTLRHSVRTLLDYGVISGRYDPLPQTRGNYGTIFALSNEVIHPSKPVSPLRLYRTQVYGDPAIFRYGEIVTGELGKGGRRGNYGMADNWINTVANEGLDRPAFTTIGRWRRGEEGKAVSNVYIPFFTIDIDRIYVYDAWEDAQSLCKTLESEGFDPERIYVSFSGGRGFHIQISSDQIANPIFRDADAARIVCEDFSAYLSEGITVDPSVNSPLSLIRVSGSRHEDTGLFKATFTMAEFMTLPYEEVMETTRTGRPFTFPKAYAGEAAPEAFTTFDELQAASEERYDRMRIAARKTGFTGPTRTVKALLNGVKEGEPWHDYHSGRNKAGFILACFLLADRNTGDHQIDQVRKESGPYAALHQWNERNNPPMNDRELWSAYGSAHRRVLGTRPNPNER